MAKIGLLTCANVTQDMGCPMSGCIMAIQGREGYCQIHANDPEAQLMGVITCAGCPTAIAPEKILSRVRGLVALGADTIHFSSCLTMICPFFRKYEAVVSKEFPQVRIVAGTHTGPAEAAPEELREIFVTMARELLTAPRRTLPDAMLAAMTPPAPDHSGD